MRGRKFFVEEKMFKRLFLVFCLLAMPQQVWAKEVFSSADKADLQNWLEEDQSLNQSLNAEKINILPQTETKKSNLAQISAENAFISDTPAVSKPSCGDKKLTDKVLVRIAQYYKKNPQRSIMDLRHQNLLLKNLESFEKVDLTRFSPQENYAVSDKLIEYKINRGIKEEDMQLCRSQNENKIYLLIYPENNFYTVEILNFADSAQGKNLSLEYN